MIQRWWWWLKRTYHCPIFKTLIMVICLYTRNSQTAIRSVYWVKRNLLDGHKICAIRQIGRFKRTSFLRKWREAKSNKDEELVHFYESRQILILGKTRLLRRSLLILCRYSSTSGFCSTGSPLGKGGWRDEQITRNWIITNNYMMPKEILDTIFIAIQILFHRWCRK